MPDLFKPLNDQEIEQLDQFLLDRIPEDDVTEEMEEGIIDLASLDGFFTAIVSSPDMILPSQWLPLIWGDFEPEWQTTKQFDQIYSLMIRHMNNIAHLLINQPEDFDPLFPVHKVKGKTHFIVDDWCFGYMMGVQLLADRWELETLDMKILITPIEAYGTEAGWELLATLEKWELENIRREITLNVREIHAYWLARREASSTRETTRTPTRRQEPRIGRNDPCPCGSGKKFKKCCLH